MKKIFLLCVASINILSFLASVPAVRRPQSVRSPVSQPQPQTVTPVVPNGGNINNSQKQYYHNHTATTPNPNNSQKSYYLR
jgi:hypothetical protein